MCVLCFLWKIDIHEILNCLQMRKTFSEKKYIWWFYFDSFGRHDLTKSNQKCFSWLLISQIPNNFMNRFFFNWIVQRTGCSQSNSNFLDEKQSNSDLCSTLKTSSINFLYWMQKNSLILSSSLYIWMRKRTKCKRVKQII